MTLNWIIVAGVMLLLHIAINKLPIEQPKIMVAGEEMPAEDVKRIFMSVRSLVASSMYIIVFTITTRVMLNEVDSIALAIFAVTVFVVWIIRDIQVLLRQKGELAKLA